MSLLGQEAAPAENQQQAAPPAQGAQASWRDSLPEEFKSEPSLQNIQDINALAKGYISAQKMVGADKIVLPKDGDEQAYLNVMKKLGLPETVDKYDVKVADGMKVDEPFFNALKAEAHKAGIPPKQFQKLFDAYSGLTSKQMETMQAAKIQESEQGINKLKAEWGVDWSKNVLSAQAAIKNFGGEEFSKEYLEESGLGNDPKFIKFMSRIGASLAEDTFKGGGNAEMGMNPAKAQQEINSIYANPAYTSRNHPEHKQLVDRMSALNSYLYPEEK